MIGHPISNLLQISKIKNFHGGEADMKGSWVKPTWSISTSGFEFEKWF